MQKVCGKTFFGWFWRLHGTCMGYRVLTAATKAQGLFEDLQSHHYES